MSGGKNASANFVWRCGSCKRQHSASFEPAVPPRPYSAESNGQFARLVELDCRGLEFVGFDPRVSESIRHLFLDVYFSHAVLCIYRAFGHAKEPSLGLYFQRWICLRANGLITTRRYAVYSLGE